MHEHTHFLPSERLPVEAVQAQADRLKQNPIFLALLDTATDLLAISNGERQIVLCNHACAEAGGLESREDAIGKRLGELLHCIHASEQKGGCGTSPACRFCGLAISMAIGMRGEQASGECLMQCLTGAGMRNREFAVEARPLPELGPGWLCYSLSDLSHEKRKQALERIFFHDIMNRAASILGVSQAMSEPDTTAEEQKILLCMLSVSARAMVDEIASQRALHAAENGELAIHIETVDPVQTLYDAALACEAFGYAENKWVKVEECSGAPRVRTDRTLLGRVLLNLLKNALESTQPRSAVKTGLTTSGTHLTYFVHNQAAMPQNVRTHIFQRSFSTKGAGRGLGTYSARLLTENYLRGTVSFETSPTGGTTFYVKLPL